jgi:hypothetical protein
MKENSTDKFFKKISDWLLPKGYVEVFSNHPNAQVREFHFSKDGVRIVCPESYEEYCYLSISVTKCPHNLNLRSGLFGIGSDRLDEMHEYMKSNAKLLLKN